MRSSRCEQAWAVSRECSAIAPLEYSMHRCGRSGKPCSGGVYSDERSVHAMRFSGASDSVPMLQLELP